MRALLLALKRIFQILVFYGIGYLLQEGGDRLKIFKRLFGQWEALKILEQVKSCKLQKEPKI
tara:strand:+ start:17663 stop:17848 length:186 start_codon:yes stop_codon:yes gene_type:complete